MQRLCCAAVLALAVASVAVSAQDTLNDIVPEALVEEMAPEAPSQAGGAVGISRECFERTCSTAGFRLARMPCRSETLAPWAVFVSPETRESKLVNVADLKEEHSPGLVDIVEHKHALNPNVALPMPGIPAKASPKLLHAMKKQSKLLHKIVKMEKWEYQKDPLHKRTRKKWLTLAATIKHLPPGPDKMKEQVLLLKLAKQLADKEKIEEAQAKKIVQSPHNDEPSVTPAMLKKIVASGKEGAGASADAAGLPVSHRHCFERACITHLPNGECGAAVVSCSVAKNDKAAALEGAKDLAKILPLVAGDSKN